MHRIARFATVVLTLALLMVLGGRGKLRDEAAPTYLLEGDTLCVRIAIEGGIYINQGHPSGFHHDMLKQFTRHERCHLRLKPREDVNYWEELISGETDILVISAESVEIPDEFIGEVISSVDVNDAGHAWVVSRGNIILLQQLNYWLTYFKQKEEYSQIVKRYLRPYRRNHFTMSSAVSQLSPYDELIKRYSKTIGWDWRLLASLIYQESKFSMNVSSVRGAHGLMQVRSATAKQFGIDDIFDPEQNVRAGTMLIKRLQKMYETPEIDSLNRIKLVLAAYNAGEGRVEDIRRFAEHIGADPNSWDSLREIIPQMRKRENIPGGVLKFGQFKGTETIKFIDEILERYDTYAALVKK